MNRLCEGLLIASLKNVEQDWRNIPPLSWLLSSLGVPFVDPYVVHSYIDEAKHLQAPWEFLGMEIRPAVENWLVSARDGSPEALGQAREACGVYLTLVAERDQRELEAGS